MTVGQRCRDRRQRIAVGALLAGVASSLSACGGNEAVVAPIGEAAAPPAVTASSTPPRDPGDGALDALVAGTGKPPRPGSAEQMIARVATEFATSRDAERRCHILAGEGLVSFLGSFVSSVDEYCVRNLREADRFGFGTGLRLRSIEVDPSGVEASATVTHVGGLLDGVTGRWLFSKVRGEYQAQEKSRSGMWKVTYWELDYLRSREERTLGPGYVPAGSDDALADAGVRDCTNRALQAYNDEDFHSNFYLQFYPQIATRSAVILGCLQQQAPGDGERLRNAYRFELRRALSYSEFPAPAIECGLRSVFAARGDEEVERAAVDAEASGELESAVFYKAEECAGGPVGDPSAVAPAPAAPPAATPR